MDAFPILPIIGVVVMVLIVVPIALHIRKRKHEAFQDAQYARQAAEAEEKIQTGEFQPERQRKWEPEEEPKRPALQVIRQTPVPRGRRRRRRPTPPGQFRAVHEPELEYEEVGENDNESVIEQPTETAELIRQTPVPSSKTDSSNGTHPPRPTIAGDDPSLYHLEFTDDCPEDASLIEPHHLVIVKRNGDETPHTGTFHSWPQGIAFLEGLGEDRCDPDSLRYLRQRAKGRTT